MCTVESGSWELSNGRQTGLAWEGVSLDEGLRNIKLWQASQSPDLVLQLGKRSSVRLLRHWLPHADLKEQGACWWSAAHPLLCCSLVICPCS